MMTALVATLGLLPAALSHDIGSDSQRPFALVIVGGLLTNLAISVFLLPTLYAVLAGRGDLAVPLAIAEGASPTSRARRRRAS
jgi:cobalt-zinc-cadmium resistance protein CzcA